MSRRRARLPVALLLALLLGACAGHAPTRQESTSALAAQRWQARCAALRQLPGFTLEARVAASGSYGVSGDLRWRQRGDHFTLHFSGPFGAGAFDVSGTPGDVEIRSGDKTYHTRDPEAFLRQAYGWTLPVTGLRDWVLGIPADTTPAQASYDDDGRALRLMQDGWIITYDDYQGAAGLALPWHFSMLAGKTRFRIVIDRWSDLPESAGDS